MICLIYVFSLYATLLICLTFLFHAIESRDDFFVLPLEHVRVYRGEVSPFSRPQRRGAPPPRTSAHTPADTSHPGSSQTGSGCPDSSQPQSIAREYKDDSLDSGQTFIS